MCFTSPRAFESCARISLGVNFAKVSNTSPRWRLMTVRQRKLLARVFPQENSLKVQSSWKEIPISISCTAARFSPLMCKCSAECLCIFIASQTTCSANIKNCGRGEEVLKLILTRHGQVNYVVKSVGHIAKTAWTAWVSGHFLVFVVRETFKEIKEFADRESRSSRYSGEVRRNTSRGASTARATCQRQRGQVLPSPSSRIEWR